MSEGGEGAQEILAHELVEEYPVEAAQVLERFDAADVAALLSEEEPAAAAAVMRALSAPLAREAVGLMEPPAAAGLLAELPVPWAATLLRIASRERVDALLAGVTDEHAGAVRRALEQRPGSVGALADPAVMSLAPDVDVEVALERVRAGHGAQGERATDRVYVVARGGRLVGVVGVAQIVTAGAGTRLEDLMVADVVALHAADDAVAIAGHRGWLTWRSLPVVDDDGQLVGVVRFDAVRQLLMAQPAHRGGPAPLPVSLAELFWLGLTGVADGLARRVASTVASEEEADER